MDFGFVNPTAVSGLKTIPLYQDEMLAVLCPGIRSRCRNASPCNPLRPSLLFCSTKESTALCWTLLPLRD